MEDDSNSNDVAFNTFIGVVVSVCGNALISVALNLQKRAHNKIQEQQMANYFANMDNPPHWISSQNNYGAFFPDDGYSSPRASLEGPNSEAELLEQQKFIMSMAQEQTKGGETDYLKSKLWWLGISLMVLGEVGNFVAYGFAPASTIAPLGTTTLVSNVILAPLMLKEVFRKRDLLGVVLAVTGAAMVVLSSNSEEIALSPELIMEALTQTQSIIYFILTGVAIVALTILSPLYGAYSIMIDLGLVAIYGGYTVLSTKSVASLLSLTFFKMFAYPVSYLLIFVLVVTAVLQIKYLNKALQRFDSTEVIPTQFVLFTVSAIIGSAVLYHDFDGMDMEQMSRFMSGCSIEFLGVYLITSKRTKRINSPALSISADSGTAVSYTDEEEALDRVDALPSEQSTPNTPIPTESRRNAHKRMGMINPNMAAPFIIRSSPPTHDTWPDANKGSLNHRRQSSVFRGISMASQLLDRNDEPPIQLPSSSPRQSGIFNNPSHHRRGDSALGNILSGLSSVITPHSNYDAQEADAVEIEIPTPSTFHHDESERELLPLNRKRNSKLDIEQDTEDRDLS